MAEGPIPSAGRDGEKSVRPLSAARALNTIVRDCVQLTRMVAISGNRPLPLRIATSLPSRLQISSWANGRTVDFPAARARSSATALGFWPAAFFAATRPLLRLFLSVSYWANMLKQERQYSRGLWLARKASSSSGADATQSGTWSRLVAGAIIGNGSTASSLHTAYSYLLRHFTLSDSLRASAPSRSGPATHR